MDKEGRQRLIYVVLIVVSILLLAYMDFIVLEKIYHPIARDYDIPWSAFTPVIAGVELLM